MTPKKMASKPAAGSMARTVEASPSSQDLAEDVYVSTNDAAQMLGVSVGTVQKMVANQVLQAWRTNGGHRRISQASIDLYRKQLFNGSDPWTTTAKGSVRALFLDNDSDTLQTARAASQRCADSVTCLFLTNGMEAMMTMMAQPPDVIFAELELIDLDGIELLRNLEKTEATAKTHLVALTTWDDVTIAARGGIPAKAVLVRKPLQSLWLEGFLSALKLGSRR